MPKDIHYHQAVIEYNRRFAELGEQMAEETDDPTVKKWCAGIGRQHRFHEKQHINALRKLEEENVSINEPSPEPEAEVLSAAEQQKLAAEEYIRQAEAAAGQKESA